MSGTAKAPSKQKNRRRLAAAAAIIAVTVVSVGIFNWYMASQTFTSTRQPKVWSMNLEQNGTAVFNLTNYLYYALTVTHVWLSWGTSNYVDADVTSSNNVPPHQSIVITVSFGINWQKGVRYDFLLYTAQGEQVSATTTG